MTRSYGELLREEVMRNEIREWQEYASILSRRTANLSQEDNESKLTNVLCTYGYHDWVKVKGLNAIWEHCSRCGIKYEELPNDSHK